VLDFSVGLVGMSHLGLVTSTAISYKGIKTVCYDPDEHKIELIKEGKLEISEPDIEATIERNGPWQKFTSNISELADCKIIYLSQDVKTLPDNTSDLSDIRRLFAAIKAICSKDAIIVILCQVPPGFTRSLDFPEEKLFYQVETLVFGRALARAICPERIILGAHNTTHTLKEHYTTLLQEFGCPILKMNYESAELCKISINMFLVASVTTANMLADIAEKIGANWSDIVPALQLDHRIGEHAYIKPGLGISGGNLERDMMTTLALAKNNNTEKTPVEAYISSSARRRNWVYALLQDKLFSRYDNPIVAIWGVAYKVDTNSTKNSPAIALLEKIADKYIKWHDPLVTELPIPCGKRYGSPVAALLGADVLIIMTPWPEYSEIEPAIINRALAGKIILDPFGILPTDKLDISIDYMRLGSPKRSVSSEESTYA